MKLNNLQILRGISALLVCCFHFKEYINFKDLPIGNILFAKGSIGVSVFFVISGFIMAFTTLKKDFSIHTSKEIKLFYKRRIIRIVPLYFLLSAGWMIIGGTLMFYFHGEGLRRLIHSVLFLPQKDTFPVLYLGWSLNYEMFFYLIFGLSLFFKKGRYIFISVFFIATYMAGLLFPTENAYLKMVSSHLNLYFVVGILFALLLDKISIRKIWAQVLCTAGILLFSAFLFNFIVISNSLLVLFVVSLFVLSFLLLDYTLHFKGNRLLIFLGDISYSLYLSHPFVELFFRRFKVEGYLNIPYFILKLIIVIGLAAFLYYFVEKKITYYLKLKLKA
ncbi:Peptidoglycan/LPS O-acetylase OafA/YrhL, contains acyltransferase and SGNH-hydrolase domains [Chryseobacterium oleae]|uniref:Peptidoglycan/LPS O-acetylase OafA/YrhL, contains acyltransferase and SGNH-hydrolase domains n=1 Tax=Chryseobacterium oleae TaxID=491207 RepID=A0A1I4ZCU4_CHROL|nr:acyltransferase [Chryseobacterium oleae]SFN47809.1 Peptidoglycan/LPS O-acetylase OafA/YrhL, contains acyltransferase and SGNH-hydrolase domains [Chryseobacterium oleae]